MNFASRMQLSILVLTLLTSVPSVMAGGASSAGGDGYSCYGQEEGKIGLSDIDQNRENFIPDSLFDFSTDDIVFDSVLAYLDQTQPDVAQSVRKTLSGLTFLKVDKTPNLDTGVKTPWWMKIEFCVRKQTAVQIFSSNTVLLNKKDYAKLHTLTQALLRLHEVFIREEYSSTLSLKDLETRARARVQAIFSAKDFNQTVIAEVSRRSNGTKNVDQILTMWADNVFMGGPIVSVYSIPGDDVYKYSDSHKMELEVTMRAFSRDQLFDAGFNVNSTLAPCGLPFGAKMYADMFYGGDVNFILSAEHVSYMVRERGLNLYQIGPNNQPFIFWIGLNRGWDAVYSLDVQIYNDTESNFATGTPPHNPPINYNTPWCQPGVAEGGFATTLLDLALAQKKPDLLFIKFLRDWGGAKTAIEAGLTCHAIPSTTTPVDPFSCGL